MLYAGAVIISVLALTGEVVGKQTWLLVAVLIVLALTVAAGLTLRRHR